MMVYHLVDLLRYSLYLFLRGAGLKDIVAFALFSLDMSIP